MNLKIEIDGQGTFEQINKELETLMKSLEELINVSLLISSPDAPFHVFLKNEILEATITKV